jgi:hypothetical protein
MSEGIYPGQEPEIAPGVHGYLIEEDNVLWIPVIWAQTPGQGDVGRFLDGLPRDKTVRFPTVLSAQLAIMLGRRGFLPTQVWAPEFGEAVNVWERKATT